MCFCSPVLLWLSPNRMLNGSTNWSSFSRHTWHSYPGSLTSPMMTIERRYIFQTHRLSLFAHPHVQATTAVRGALASLIPTLDLALITDFLQPLLKFAGSHAGSGSAESKSSRAQLDQ